MGERPPHSVLVSGTHALIDLDAYVENIRLLRSMAPPASAFMAVVKANAYGHGAVFCARAATEAGVEWLGVARIAEGIQLRRAGEVARILVLGPPNATEIEAAIAQDITIAIGSEASLRAIQAVAAAPGVRISVHLKVDTGMRRYGVRPDDALRVARKIRDSETLALEGAFTHFTSADDADVEPTRRQLRIFEKAITTLRADGIDPPLTHVGNSPAVLAGWIGETNLVRCGIATYGLSPSAEAPVGPEFRPVMSLRSVVGRKATIEAGETVSYGQSWSAPARDTLGTVPIGYADGIPRQLSNAGWFSVGNTRAPIRGRVCMDQTIISVPPSTGEGDSVLVFGDGRNGEMTLDDIAAIAGTNNYEIATRVTARVPRLYMRGGAIVAWDDPLFAERGVVGAS